MKNFLLLFFAVLLLASSTDDILEKIKKDSPDDYNFAIELIKKTNSLKNKKVIFDSKITTQKEFLDKFLELVNLNILREKLPHQIDELNKKIEILSNSDKTIDKLQLLYYKKLLEITQKRLDFINANFKDYENILFEKLNSIEFDKNDANKKIEFYKKLLLEKQKEFEQLNINLHKWQLLNNKTKIEKIKNDILENLNKQKKIYKNLTKTNLIFFFDDLKNKNKQSFQDLTESLKFAKNVDNTFYNSILEIGTHFEKKIFGVKTFLYSAKNDVNFFFEKFLKVINYPIFKVGNRNITLVNFIIFILLIIVSFYLARKYKELIYKIRGQYELSYSTATLLANLGYYTIISVSFLISLKSVGLDLSSLAMIAGALSVGIGFGLQNIVSNFVSGIIVMFEKSIKIGDYIEIDDDTRGEVVDITMRSTIIKTNDNINLIIPNQTFITNNVINWTLGDDKVRFRIPFGVAYGSKIEEVEKVVLDALKKSNLPYLKEKEHEPLIVFEEMGDSGLNFELFVWVKDIYARRPRRTKNDFLRVIYNALNDAKIEIPFPQQDVHIKELPELRLKKD